VVWFEVMGEDGDKLQSFYRGLFGWKIDAGNPTKYGMVEAAERLLED
jgi:predicted enzyme related to lactoylglutathione lyase